MLRLRLKRTGRKRLASYRIVVMEQATRRDGRPIDELGFYNPITKQSTFDIPKITNWLKVGAQPSETVLYLVKKADIIQA